MTYDDPNFLFYDPLSYGIILDYTHVSDDGAVSFSLYIWHYSSKDNHGKRVEIDASK